MVEQVNLALALVLELGVLAALPYWGFATGATIPVKIVLGIGAPAAAILVWAIWGDSPLCGFVETMRRCWQQVRFALVCACCPGEYESPSLKSAAVYKTRS